jgi:hypothetical protein
MKEKSFKPIFIFLTIWGAIQIARLIAIPLMGDILSGKAQEAWMFPAILDTVTALLSFFFLYAIWKKRTFATWMYSFLYLSISIIDHIDGAVAGALTAAPALFGGPERDKVSLIISLLAPAVIDAIALYLLSRKDVRGKFFEVKE